MRFSIAFVAVLFFATACTSTAVDESLAEPDAPVSTPVAPTVPERAGADGPRAAEDVCGDMSVAGKESSRGCTEMGCTNGFHLGVEPLDAWPHGKYRYVLDVDGHEVTCEGSLPLQGCETPNITCSDAAYSVTESGCAIAPRQHAFGDVMIPGFPSSVHLRVEHEGKPVLDEALDLKYGRVQPNGPGCGPVCCQAVDRVELKFP
jgi:hypothetical protein